MSINRIYTMNLRQGHSNVTSSTHNKLPLAVARLLVVAFLTGSMASLAFSQDQSTALVNAHAHNDYEHERPLLDAYELGFRSIEADIYLIEGKLLVAHDREDVRKERTLQSLYLDPLFERFQTSRGQLFAGDKPLVLLVDIKSEATATYKALHDALTPYREMLTRRDGDRTIEGAMTIVISGNRDFEAIENTANRMVGIDGRTKDLQSDIDHSLLPLISDNWNSQFTWRGNGEMPENQRQKLHEYVRTAHDAGRMVRFWATPENEDLWKELLAANVDLIGTDDLERLARFLRSANDSTK